MKLKKITKREMAYKRLQYGILYGGFNPGEKLVEKDLSTLFNIGTTPIREAIRQLQSEGLIEVVSNKGAVVKKIPPENVLEVLEVSAVLEEYAVEISVKSIKPEEKRRLKALADEVENALKGEDAGKYILKEASFHEIFPLISRNSTLAHNIKNLRNQYLRYLGVLMNVKDHSDKIINAHDNILDAINTGDSKTAGRLMKQHILDIRKDISGFFKHANWF